MNDKVNCARYLSTRIPRVSSHAYTRIFEASNRMSGSRRLWESSACAMTVCGSRVHRPNAYITDTAIGHYQLGFVTDPVRSNKGSHQENKKTHAFVKGNSSVISIHKFLFVSCSSMNGKCSHLLSYMYLQECPETM